MYIYIYACKCRYTHVSRYIPIILYVTYRGIGSKDSKANTINTGWWCNVPILKNEKLRQWVSDDIPYMKWKNNPNVPNHQPDIHDYTNDRYGLCMYMANIDRYTSTLACQKIARRENGGTCIKGTCIKGTCKQPDIWAYVPVMRRKHRLLTGTHIKARGFRRTEVYHVFILHMKYTIVLIYIYIYIILLIYLYLNIYIILYLYIYVYIYIYIYIILQPQKKE